MIRKFAMLALVLAATGAGLAADLQRQDQLVWDFAEFVEAFAGKDWRRAARFVTPDTKAGFGGEQGMEGVMQMYGEDALCHERLTRVLESGCRKSGEGDAMRCVAPPQLGPDVVYLGARASFRYDIESERWVAEFLICGGD